eukprot:6334714-Pyramimonas_sp.AAC.1
MEARRARSKTKQNVVSALKVRFNETGTAAAERQRRGGGGPGGRGASGGALGQSGPQVPAEQVPPVPQPDEPRGVSVQSVCSQCTVYSCASNCKGAHNTPETH